VNHKELVESIICRESGIHVAFDIFEGWMWPGMTKLLMEYFEVDRSDELLEKMGASCRWVTPYYCGPTLPASAKERVASPHTTHSLNSAIWKFLPGIKGYELSDLKYPLADVHSPHDLDVFPWPSPRWFDFDGMAYTAHQFPEDFVIAGGFSPLFLPVGRAFRNGKSLD
jgi:hypothetical protein